MEKGHSINSKCQGNPEIKNNINYSQLMFYIESSDVFSLKEAMINFSLSLKNKNILLKKAMTLLHNAKLIDKTIISVILSSGAKPNLKLKIKGKTKTDFRVTYAFFIAVESEDINLIGTFLYYGAMINLKDDKGRNCLFYMIRTSKDVDMLCPLCLFLIEKGVNVNEPDVNGYTPLMEAVNNDSIVIVGKFLQAQADVNAVNCKDGNTSLHYAIQNSNKEIVSLLLKYHPSIHIKNHNNETPIQIAQRCSDVVIYGLLLKYQVHLNDHMYNKQLPLPFVPDIYHLLTKFLPENHPSRIEIPFIFQKTPKEEGYTTKVNDQFQHNSPLHSLISINNTPTLYIDISTDENQSKLVHDGLDNDNKIISSQVHELQLELSYLNIEQNNLKKIFANLKEEFVKSNEEIYDLNNLIKAKEQHQMQEFRSYKSKLETQELLTRVLKSQCDQKELDSRRLHSHSINYLKNKFCIREYNNDYMTKMLTNDLLDYQMLIQNQMKTREPIIRDLISNLQEIVNSVCPNITIRMIGSYATKLSIPSSNLDLLLISNTPNNKVNEMALIQSLYIKLHIIPWVSSVMFLSSYAPSLQVVTNEQYSRLMISITVPNDIHDEVECVEITNKLMEDYDAFEPLILAIKNILRISNSISFKKDGFNSYVLTLMIFYYLQLKKSNFKISPKPRHNLGELFINLLYFYGYIYDYSNNSICIILNGKPTLRNDTSNNLCSKSKGTPLNNGNNPSEKTDNISDVKSTFMISHYISSNNCECGCHYNTSNTENNYEGRDHCILNKIFNTVNHVTLSRHIVEKE